MTAVSRKDAEQVFASPDPVRMRADLANPLMSDDDIERLYPQLPVADLAEIRDQAARELAAPPAPKAPRSVARAAQDPLPANPSIEALIGQAVQNGTPIETMERLMAMRRELKEEAAKEAFDADMSALQGDLPVIRKTKSVAGKDGKERYRFAPLDSIVDQTKEYIARHGFSYSVTTDQSEAREMRVTCTVKHKLGHSEDSTIKVPIDSDSFMSAPQKVGAASTFAKRYAFCNAFGIMTGDDDTDALTPEDPPARQAPPPAASRAPAERREQPEGTAHEGILAVTAKEMVTSKNGTIYASLKGNFRAAGEESWTALEGVKAWKNTHYRMHEGGAYRVSIEETEYRDAPSWSVTAFLAVVKPSPKEQETANPPENG